MPRLTSLLLIGLLCASGPITTHAQDAGLAERRAIATYAADIWPRYEAEIQGLAGFPVPITLDLKSLALPGLADSYASEDYLRKPVIDPILQAVGTITATDIGRTALKDGLKSIVIHYDEKTAPSSNYRDGVSMENGVLSINWKPFTNVDDVEPRAMALINALEAAL